VENGDNYSTAPEEEHEKECPWQLGAVRESVECKKG